jgi:hypothetical protein
MVLASNQVGPGSIAVDATNVYWVTSTPVDFGTPQIRFDSSLVTMPLGGGTPTTLVSHQVQTVRIVVDAANIYWLNLGTSANGYADGAVMKAPLQGGTPITLAAAQRMPSDIAVDGTNVYWTTSGSQGFNSSDGAVMKMSLAGGVPTTIASGQLSAQALAIDATSIYWANGYDGSVMKATPK